MQEQKFPTHDVPGVQNPVKPQSREEIAPRANQITKDERGTVSDPDAVVPVAERLDGRHYREDLKGIDSKS